MASVSRAEPFSRSPSPASAAPRLFWASAHWSGTLSRVFSFRLRDRRRRPQSFAVPISRSPRRKSGSGPFERHAFAGSFLQGFAIGRDGLREPRRPLFPLAEPRERRAETIIGAARSRGCSPSGLRDRRRRPLRALPSRSAASRTSATSANLSSSARACASVSTRFIVPEKSSALAAGFCKSSRIRVTRLGSFSAGIAVDLRVAGAQQVASATARVAAAPPPAASIPDLSSCFSLSSTSVCRFRARALSSPWPFRSGFRGLLQLA
jgi:hypothetical protein